MNQYVRQDVGFEGKKAVKDSFHLTGCVCVHTIPADEMGLREAGSLRLWLRGMVEQRLMLPLFPMPFSPPVGGGGCGVAAVVVVAVITYHHTL